jgi:hypothetical protein
MKKLFIAALTLSGAMGVYAQGVVEFNNDIIGSLIFHVWSPNVSNPSVEVTGNNSVAYSSPSARQGDLPAGTQTYTGTLIGGNSTSTGSAGWGNGNNYSADLLAAPGDNASPSSLTVLAGSLSTFRNTAGNGGWVVASGNGLSIPGTTYAGSGVVGVPSSATLQIQAWYSGGGAFPTYASAVAAGMPAGESATWNLDSLGGGQNAPSNLTGAQSFSLVIPVPEPSMIALGVMGGCAFLARRRMLKK